MAKWWFTTRRVVRIVRRRVRVSTLAGSRQDYLAQKTAARILVERRLRELNTQYGFSYQRIAIKNNATRWGSCSRQGNLNFHYKIVYLPPELADYVLVHELCHLKELNHSRAFWALVTKAIPNYRQLKLKLHHWSKSVS